MPKLGCCVDKRCNEHTCMNLPNGKTCADCLHVYRCTSIFGMKPEDVACSFFPRRFADRAKVRAAPVIRETTVVDMERMPRCCDSDYKCPCGHRVTVYGHDLSNDAENVVQCNSCGRPHRFGGGKKCELPAWIKGE